MSMILYSIAGSLTLFWALRKICPSIPGLFLTKLFQQFPVVSIKLGSSLLFQFVPGIFLRDADISVVRWLNQKCKLYKGIYVCIRVTNEEKKSLKCCIALKR